MNKTKRIIQTNKLWPVCNYDFSQADETNFGYARGLFPDGTPFAAEVSIDTVNGDTSLVLYFQLEDKDIEKLPKEEQTVVEPKVISLEDVKLLKQMPQEKITAYNRLLMIGMSAYEDDEGDLEEVQDTIAYLEQQGVIQFTTPVRNGYLLRAQDLMGQEIVVVSIVLYEELDEVCKTPLCFTAFPQNKQNLQVVKEKTFKDHIIAEVRKKILGTDI